MGLDIAVTSPSKELSKAPLSAQVGNGQVNRRPEDTQAWHGKVLLNRVVPPTVQSANEASKLRAGAISPVAENQKGFRTHLQASSGADLKSENRERVERKLSDSFKTKTQINSKIFKTCSQHPNTFLAASTMEGHGQVAEAPMRAAEVPESVSHVRRVVSQEHLNTGDFLSVIRRLEALEQRIDLLIDMVQGTEIQQGGGLLVGQNYDVRRPRFTANPPPKFNGQKPREWLNQMEHYYRILGGPDSMRVRDVFSFLEGAALSHYCFAQKDGREPKTWEEFSQLITQRFCPCMEGETRRPLRGIQWNGSLDSLMERFARVLEEGTPPSARELVRILMGRIPWPLLSHLGRVYFPSWTAMSEALQAATNSSEILKEYWLAEAVPELYRFGTGEPNYYMEKNKRSVDRIKPQKISVESRKDLRAEIRCHTCGGVGHKAHTCPTRKAAAICNNCGGKGHRARDCTTRQPRVPYEVNINKKDLDYGMPQNEKRSFPVSGDNQA